MGPANTRNAASNRNARQNLTRNLLAGGGGFEPPLRGPEPRVLPLDDPPPTPPTLPYPPTRDRPVPRAESANRGLEGAARAEARHLGRRNLNLLAGARV